MATVNCPWQGCGTTFNPMHPQVVQWQHFLAEHLPFALFCTIESCYRRFRHEHDYEAHLHNAHPQYGWRQPGEIYDRNLILQYIFVDGVSVQIAERRALGIIWERRGELGREVEWEDPCGRRAIAGWCRCDPQQN